MVKYLKELFKFRELLLELTKREIKVRYKQTTLGVAWAILQPLSLMLIFTLIFGIILTVESEDIPYPLFSYSALLPWTFFATSISFGALSIINNSNLITKVYFPREVLPFSSLAAAFLDLIVATSIFVGLLIYYKTPLTINFLYIVPIILIQTIFTAGVLLLLSALIVRWRDLKFVIPLLTQLWMFATPIIYPLSKIPENLRFVYTLNPMTPIIDNFRAVTILGKAPNFNDLLLATVIALMLFFIGYIFFKKLERKFADII